MYTSIPMLKDYQQAFSAFDGYCIAYFRHEVLVGRWEDGHARFVHEPKWEKIQELHIFNTHCEYRVVKVGDGSFKLRIRHDEDNQADVFDESILIIGDSAAQTTKEDFFVSREKGRSITLPTQLAKKAIVIRNYLSFEEPDPQNMPGCEIMRITDWRFVKFADENRGEEVHKDA